MIFTILIFYSIIIQVNTVLQNILCSLPTTDEVIIQNVPSTFELNVPYTVTLSSNNSILLSYGTLDVEFVETITNASNASFCLPKNESSSLSYVYKTDFVLKFDKNSTKTRCIQLKLNIYRNSTKIKIADLCTNSTTDKIFDSDDKYDVQSYMRTINTTEIALSDNFNWLIFGPRVQQFWYTHEGMRLSRECDVAEDGRVAIFNNLRGKRRLISRPIDVSNVSLLYMRLGSGTCPPPAPTDPPVQFLITTDCLNYSNWHVIYSQRILSDIEYVTVPILIRNITNSSTVCLKIEQKGDKFTSNGAWFIDDLLMIRTRLQHEYFFDNFQSMQPANWYRLAGGQLKTCNDRMSMSFESNPDIRTEIGATTIDFPLRGSIDYNHDALFHLSKNHSIDWTKWNATGSLDLNETCTKEDVITFNGEIYRQLCSPIIHLGKIDSIRFTLSTEPCIKRNKYIPTANAVIFLSVFYNGTTMGYSRTIRRILLHDIQQTHKTFHIRFDQLHHDAKKYGRICLSQYHQSSGKNVDVWSVRDFTALPLLQTDITHYVQLNLNTKCSSSSNLINSNGLSSQSVNIEYSVDFGKSWHLLLQPCLLDSACSNDIQHVYSSSIVLPSSGWHRITLPLSMATLQEEYIRFRIGTPPMATLSEPWAIERIFIGPCAQGCSGHGWCRFNACRCDDGFSGEFCEKSNTTLINRVSFLFDNSDNQTDLITYQGGRLSYKCDIISQGKALVFSKAGFRFLRISNVNGSSPKLLEFTLRLGSSNAQCYGTSKTDVARDIKSVSLLTSCSNGVHWTIVDRFRITDILAPDFGTISRIIFDKKLPSPDCLIEWRQSTHGGDNQDVWAIDDITIRDVLSPKLIKRNLHLKTFQTKLVYIRPGYILTFRLESNKLFDLNDIRLRINFTQIDLKTYGDLFSYQTDNSALTFILTFPKEMWFKHIILNLTITPTKKFDLSLIHIGVQCEYNCWINGFCLEGMCLFEQEKIGNQLRNLSLNENDLNKYKNNVLNDELLLPFIDSIGISTVHFQTIASVKTKNNLLFECSPNGGVKWFELGTWSQDEDLSLQDHYVLIPTVCQEKNTLFRWKNISIRIINIAFIKSQMQYYFMDQFKQSDASKWLYPTYSINSSGLYTNKIENLQLKKSIFQIVSTPITLKQHDYVIMIDTNSNLTNTRLQIDYSVDNITWHQLIDTKDFERPINRFGQKLPRNILRRSILIRVQGDHSFNLNHIYIGPSCPANCYGHGKCLWEKEQAICQCDNNQTSEANCLPDDSLFSSVYETFETKLNTSLWTIPSHVKVTRTCYNRQSQTTPYLCFLPNNHDQRNYAIIGPFKTIKYVIFTFGLQYINSNNCSNQILFQYSYDNGIQWYTKSILDKKDNVFEKFDDLSINTNMYLRWIEENENPCLMWNLRTISIRTKADKNLWFENRNNFEYQTWEYLVNSSNSILQFNLQMFYLNKTNNTNWELSLEISSDISNAWSNWLPLIPPCNQTNLYCDDKILSTGSLFIDHLYHKPRNVTIPIPDNYVNQEVRFRWITNQKDGRFLIKSVYLGADCPWFCSGHGICQSNGCLCNHGYVSPFCSPDFSIVLKSELAAIELTANLSSWADVWGHEICSSNDGQSVFSKAGPRGLISPEISLTGIKYLRIQLDTCFNRTQVFLDPIYVQISLNNGILWQTLLSITYRQEPWLIDFSNDETIKQHFVRIRLFQRVTTKGTSNWILKKFEMIPEKLPHRWISNNISLSKTCNYKNYQYPLEIFSTIDIQLNETSFLTFQLDSNPCITGSPVTPNRSQFNLEYSIDYGQTWSSIDRPSTIASKPNDILIIQPLRAIKNIFYLPLYAYYPLSKFIRIRWIAANSTLASRWSITNVTIRNECEVLCELDVCNGKCRCLKLQNCTNKTTFYQQFHPNTQSLSDLIILPPLNLISTRFIEFSFHINCKQTIEILSLEYSRNLGLTWQLIKYYIFNLNQSYLIHEDLLDDMKFDHILIRFVFLSNFSKCLKLEQIVVGGSMVIQDVIYGKFDRIKNFNPNLFLSFGDGHFNGTYLIYSSENKLNSTINEIITDDMNILENVFYIQLSLVPLSLNHCINIVFSFSSDYGYSWQTIDHDEVLYFDEYHFRKTKIFTWKFSSQIIGSNQGRFRIRLDEEYYHIGISELYIGSNCINGCNSHGMCSDKGRCRCEPGWTNNDCSLSLIRFPNEIDILQQNYSTSSSSINIGKCGKVFNNTCKREFQTNYINVNHEYTYVHVKLNDQCITKTTNRKNGEGWIRLQYRQMNTYQWITLHIFKGYDLNITKLLPPIILQLRLIQDSPLNHRSPWSIEQFYIFHIHSSLKWFLIENKSNSTFLTETRQLNNTIIYETKDISFNLNDILQIEYNDTNFLNNSIEYSQDLGLTWIQIPNENQLKFVPIRFQSDNQTFYRLTITLQLSSTIRFRFQIKRNHLQYVYIGKPCLMNCFANTRCIDGRCQVTYPLIPLIDFRETFEKPLNNHNWLQLEPYRHDRNKILWTTVNGQAITRPIDLRSMRAIKWTYNFENISKTCQTSIYLLISTDGTLTWSILYQLDLPLKNVPISMELTIELESMTKKYSTGQFRWYQPYPFKCSNMTWGLSKIISIKTINVYFLTDYFYSISSSRPNWESIDGALLAQSSQCNNNLPSLILHEPSYTVVTVPILIQEFYVLVFQIDPKCTPNLDTKILECRNLTSLIEYRTESSLKWLKLADMSDLACRTSLINGGYFNIHTIKLPYETYSSGTQFRWIGTQTEGVKWSINSLFIGECPEYCHDRGLCTVSGCQCVIGYSGTYCEKYVGNETLPTWFNETFDDVSVVGISGGNSNNWIKLSGDGHIRHVCDENLNNNTNNYLNGQALHFGAGCECGNVEAITRELNISQATTISFAFHVAAEDNCVLTTKNITVAVEWTYDEGITWERLVTMYNQEHAQFFNITLPSKMMKMNQKRGIGGVRFRWTQIERGTSDTYWAIDNIRLE